MKRRQIYHWFKSRRKRRFYFYSVCLSRQQISGGYVVWTNLSPAIFICTNIVYRSKIIFLSLHSDAQSKPYYVTMLYSVMSLCKEVVRWVESAVLVGWVRCPCMLQPWAVLHWIGTKPASFAHLWWYFAVTPGSSGASSLLRGERFLENRLLDWTELLRQETEKYEFISQLAIWRITAEKWFTHSLHISSFYAEMTNWKLDRCFYAVNTQPHVTLLKCSKNKVYIY